MPTSDEPIAQIGQTLELDETDDGDAVIRNTDTDEEIVITDVVSVGPLEAASATVDAEPEADADVVRLLEHNAHLEDTDNPHATALEEARSEDNTLAGDVDMSGNGLLALASITADGTALEVNSPIDGQSPDAATHLTTKEYVDSIVQGLDWQESVIDRRNDPPADPGDGDRYLIDENPTGDWEGNADSIAEWDAGVEEWIFITPDDGFAVFDEADDLLFVYDGEAWIQFGSAISHGSLQGLSADDHPQYLLVDGSRAMGGSLDLGENDLENAAGMSSESIENDQYSEGVDDRTVSGATDLDVSTTNAFSHVLDGDTDYSITGAGTGRPGEAISILIEQDGSTQHTITWPSEIDWDVDQGEPDDPELGERLEVVLRSYDGGTTWIGTIGGRF